MSDTHTLTAARTPTVYFIDDSATMREVIKIAFRKENIHVITCADAASALAQFGDSAPDAVITDVIMPDKDGYEVCQFIKEHERFGKTPVILMSGVVNRTVAEKAMQVKADELVRKPFQPQDLIARVKSLLNPGGTAQRGSLHEEEANASQAPAVFSAAFSRHPQHHHRPRKQISHRQSPRPQISRVQISPPRPPGPPNPRKLSRRNVSRKHPRVPQRHHNAPRQPPHHHPTPKNSATKSAASSSW